MGMKILIILFLSISYLSYGQEQHADSGKKIAGIERLIHTKPDSALVLIKEIYRESRQHDTIYALASMYNGFYHLLKNKPDSSIYYYEKAIVYAKNSPSHRARALRMLAAPYRKQANYERSLQILRQAEKEYITVDNNKGLATVYGEMASNYNAMLRPQDAIPHLLKAIALLQKAGSTKEQIPIKQSLANTYLNMGNYQFASDLYEEVLAGFERTGMPKNYYLTLINYSECLINLKRHDAAKKSLLKAISGLKQFNDTEVTGSAYATLSRLEIQQHNFLQGEVYIEKAFILLSSAHSPRTVAVADFYLKCLKYFNKIEKALDIINLVDTSTFKSKANLQELAGYEESKIEIYKRSENLGLAVASARNAIELLDTLESTENKNAVIEMQVEIQNDYQKHKEDALVKKNLLLKQATAVHSKGLWFWACFSLLLLACIGFYYLHNKKRHANTLIEQKGLVSSLTSREVYSQQVNDDLRSSIETKQDELAAMELKMGTIKANVSKILNAREGDNVKNNVEHIRSELKEFSDGDNYRKLFAETFSESNADFEDRLSLRFPALSKKELFFCSLLRLSLTNKDLALLLNITPDAVKKKKSRLRKKIETAPGEELEHILAST